MLLPDINVWLALTFDSHVHHPIAKAWFDSLVNEECLFCRVTQQGFLRLATSAKVFGSHALSLIDAWDKYDLFQSDSNILYAEEPANLETEWRRFTQSQSYWPRVWMDAYLAAFARAGNWQWITFDQGFLQFAGVTCTILR